jgi:hypothetical protein
MFSYPMSFLQTDEPESQEKQFNGVYGALGGFAQHRTAS